MPDSSELVEYQRWLKAQHMLKERIQQNCADLGGSARVPTQAGHFLFDSAHKLLFCRNAKVMKGLRN